MKLNNIGIQIGDFLIAFYGLSIIIGAIASTLFGWLQCQKHNLSFEQFSLLSATCALTGIIGAKLFYIIISFKQIDFFHITNLEYFNSLMQGGFVYYGGIIGVLPGIYICQKWMKIDVRQYVNKLCMCIPILHGFGRIGCSMVGCCYGIPYKGPFSIIYKNSFFAPNNISLFPIQLVEAICEFLIAIYLIIYVNKFSGKKSFEIYLFLYAFIRFILEFFRFDDVERGIILGCSTSQYISIFIIITIFLLQIPKHNQL